jgi:uncharacterized protein with PIN domain
LPAAHFDFSPELEFFLAPGLRGNGLTCTFEYGQSVKHLVESAGVPHTEIGQVAVNGMSSGLRYLVQDGDCVSIYAILPGQGLPPNGARFILDNHLGRLAAYLRMLGFDSLYRNDLQDKELARIASEEERILLTRDRRLLMRRAVEYGYCLRSLDSRRQAHEVLQRYDLSAQVVPFRRCLRCNAPLEPVNKEAVLDHLLPLTRLYFDEFHRCTACGQVYWKGSHHERMLALISQISNWDAESSS